MTDRKGVELELNDPSQVNHLLYFEIYHLAVSLMKSSQMK